MDGFFGNIGNLSDVATIALLRVVPVLFCITIHELAHGFTAYKLGDNTAKAMGRLTLNPIKHIDPIGMLMMLIVGFGWAKPVPVDMRNFKHPKWYMAISAFAGPLSNMILAVIFMFILGFVAIPLGINGSNISVIIYTVLSLTVFLNIALAVFNMLPLPPLDGSKVLFSLLPEERYYKLLKYERYGMIFLIVLMSSRLFFNVDIFGMTIVRLARLIESGLNVFFDMGFALYYTIGIA